MNKREMMLLERRRKGIKLKELAEFIGVSIPMLSQFETGKKNLNPEFERMYDNFIINY